MSIDALRRFYHASVSVAIVANMVGTGIIFVLVAILNADVIARGVFHDPIHGVVEMVIFSLALIVFLQLPDVVRSNRLTRSDGMLLMLFESRPTVARLMTRLIDLVAGIFMALIVWTMWPEFLESFESCHFFTAPEFGPEPTGVFLTDLSAAFGRCDYAGTPGIFTAPVWPIKLAICFSVTLCTIIFLFRALIGSRGNNLFEVGDRPA
jgi:TRAP-type C4-dicarboxylate transport system permease small subunit